jgi:hypothetical protein
MGRGDAEEYPRRLRCASSGPGHGAQGHRVEGVGQPVRVRFVRKVQKRRGARQEPLEVPVRPRFVPQGCVPIGPVAVCPILSWARGAPRFLQHASGSTVSGTQGAEKGDRIGGLVSAHIKNFHSLFFIGIVEAKKVSEIDDNAWKDLFAYNKALAKKELIELPLEAGLNAPRVLAGNLLSFLFAEVISGILGKSTHIRDDSISLHIEEYDPSSRAHFYINSVLNAGNIDYPGDRAYIGGFDKHIEHHLFPFLSSRKLDEASDRVRALCEKYDLPYTEGSLGKILYEGLKVDLKVVFAA